MLQGNALETASSVEVIAAYSAPQTVVPAFNTLDPTNNTGWYVCGSFYLPRSCTARLDAIVFVTNNLLTCRLRLFDMQLLAELSGSRFSCAPLIPTRVLSGIVAMPGARMYQIQADCYLVSGSAPLATEFAVVAGATISD